MPSGCQQTMGLTQRFRTIRQVSEDLIRGLEPEDLMLQGMADASPAKWHLAHTTWFFEQFLLQGDAQHQAAPAQWHILFNSYYRTIGSPYPRPERGLLSRPALGQVLAWRQQVNGSMERLMARLEVEAGLGAAPQHHQLLATAKLGLNHEQQHQELLLMDLLDGFSRSPLEPAYSTAAHQDQPAHQSASPSSSPPLGWWHHPGGLVWLGHQGDGFHFDNESPAHQVWLEPFSMGDRLVTNGEYAAFMEDGGYQDSRHWMDEGWHWRHEHQVTAPRYWRNDGDEWRWEFTLEGRCHLDPNAPVRHLSWFEADAYARWVGARLPLEAEWETMARHAPCGEGQWLDCQHLKPRQATATPAGAPLIQQVFGDLWEWTASPYRPYPGFQVTSGAVGEYNAKFMSSQFVLRGGSFLTPAGHHRSTYRNFFSPGSRWMASGFRLARDGGSA